ncbi:hypothetical protein ETD86_19175 [Nonomuraea turkmeniaca]|uniref:Twin-arginine translocation signal domain-containing protein n=1 Tax=Nonomuraea turkmeniaca TaxID=103838 RepID=A0A5S4FIB4_9ACTN|nr:hypothetical protein ETD86_19175 [Nonomuraea turkmeniaca]
MPRSQRCPNPPMDRRGFLKGALGLGALAATGGALAGCAPGTPGGPGAQPSKLAKPGHDPPAAWGGDATGRPRTGRHPQGPGKHRSTRRPLTRSPYGLTARRPDPANQRAVAATKVNEPDGTVYTA